MAKFLPVDISLIDEGRFLESGNRELAEVQKEAIAYARVYGDKAKGAKTELTMKISLECDNPEAGSFRIKTSMRKSLPSPPAKVTIGMADKTQDGMDTLFVRSLGSGKDNPRQGVLCSEDGKRTVDQETGEVLS